MARAARASISTATDRHDLQPAHARAIASSRTRSVNYLAAFRKAARMDDSRGAAPLDAARRAVRPRRHARRYGGRPGRRAQSRARAIAACRRCRSRQLRAHASSGARGLLRRRHGRHARRRGLRARCATRFSRTTRRASPTRRACSTASTRCSRRSRRAVCAGASSPTRHARFTDPVVAALGLARARRVIVVRRHDAACQAASGAAAACGRRARALRRRAASMSATTCATCRRATRPAWRRSSRATATWAPAAIRRAWPATGWIEQPGDLLDWLPSDAAAEAGHSSARRVDAAATRARCRRAIRDAHRSAAPRAAAAPRRRRLRAPSARCRWPARAGRPS